MTTGKLPTPDTQREIASGDMIDGHAFRDHPLPDSSNERVREIALRDFARGDVADGPGNRFRRNLLMSELPNRRDAGFHVIPDEPYDDGSDNDWAGHVYDGFEKPQPQRHPIAGFVPLVLVVLVILACTAWGF
jgi:hypothetical protein